MDSGALRSIQRRARVLLNETLPGPVHTALRLSVGLIYFWFGFLKFPFVPGGSPADALVESWRPLIAPHTFIILLAIFETTLGALLLLGIGVRVVSGILVLHVLGTFATAVVGTDQIFNRAYGYYSLTLAGQYVMKNVLLLAAVFALATTRPRRHRRWWLMTPGRVTVGKRTFPVMTRDISQTGLSFFFSAPADVAVVKAGDLASVSLTTPLRSEEVHFDVRVTHCSVAEDGLRFVGCELASPIALAEALAPWLSDESASEVRRSVERG